MKKILSLLLVSSFFCMGVHAQDKPAEHGKPKKESKTHVKKSAESPVKTKK